MQTTLLLAVLCMLLAAAWGAEEHDHEEDHHEDEDHHEEEGHGHEVEHVVAHIYDANSNGFLEKAELAKVWEGVGNTANETQMMCVVRAVHTHLNASNPDKEATPHSDEVGSFLEGFYLFKVARGCKTASHDHSHDEHAHEEGEEHAHEEGEEHAHEEGEEHAHEEGEEHTPKESHEGHSDEEEPHCHELEEVESDFKEGIMACVGEVEEDVHSTCNKPSAKERWGYTMLSVVAITLIAVFGIFITLPVLMAHRYLLQVMLSFAVGALLGDTFYHIIPVVLHVHAHSGDDGHAHEEEDPLSQHEVNLKMTIILLSVLVFYMIDFFSRALLGGKDLHDAADEELGADEKGNGISEPVAEERSEVADTSKWWKWTPMTEVRQIVWVVVAADGMHNITDGLSIAAAFSKSNTLGWSTVVAAALHEIPQEVGDFAVMLASGVSPFQAIVLNLLSGLSAIIAAIIGTIIGDSSEDASEWILCVTIGSFIYLAIGVVVPELLHDIKKVSWLQLGGHVFGMSCGALTLWVIAVTEKHEEC